jgi:hypothetical protein
MALMAAVRQEVDSWAKIITILVGRDRLHLHFAGKNWVVLFALLMLRIRNKTLTRYNKANVLLGVSGDRYDKHL